MNLQQDGVPERYSCCLGNGSVLVLSGIQALQVGDGEMRSGKHLGSSLVLSCQTSCIVLTRSPASLLLSSRELTWL